MKQSIQKKSSIQPALWMLLAWSCSASALPPSPTMPEYSLVLVGGALHSCSSMALNQCQPTVQFGPLQKTQEWYQLDDQRLQLLRQWWPLQRDTVAQQTIQLLQHVLQRQKGPVRYRQTELLLALEQAASNLAIATPSWSDAEWDLLLDVLQAPQLLSASHSTHQQNQLQQRLKEQVSLQHSLDHFSLEIYQTARQLAAAVSPTPALPRIVFLTASARDPFAAVDYYQSLFEQLQTKASWLPLNAATNQAHQATDPTQSCHKLSTLLREVHHTVQRADVYPDLFARMQQFCQQGPAAAVQLIEQADAIFLNGGDQSLLLQALLNPDGTDTAALRTIRQRVQQGQLIVMGTSAGTAVQAGNGVNSEMTGSSPLPMISNGSSLRALLQQPQALPAPPAGCNMAQNCPIGLTEDSLTYRAKGGLGFFSAGILDTHFSERGRQLRLVRLAAHTDTRFAFGIDETTALLVGFDPHKRVPARLQVAGAAGVFIADLTEAKQQLQPWQIQGVQTHYLTREDTARWQNGRWQIQFAAWKKPAQHPDSSVDKPNTATHLENILQKGRFREAASQLCQYPGTHVTSALDDLPLHLQLHAVLPDNTASGTYTYGDKSYRYCSYRQMPLAVIAHN